MEAEITVTAISDTHGRANLPDLLKDYTSDILVHCGDFTAGSTNRIHKSMLSENHKQSWNNFLHELALVRDQFKAVVVVPGVPQLCVHSFARIGEITEPVLQKITTDLTFFRAKFDCPNRKVFCRQYSLRT